MRAGLRPSDDEATLTDERVAVVLVALKAVPTRPHGAAWVDCVRHEATISAYLDRKSTRLNSSHLVISYAVFCLKKKNETYTTSLLLLNDKLVGPLIAYASHGTKLKATIEHVLHVACPASLRAGHSCQHVHADSH